jgi:hypothetical protein
MAIHPPLQNVGTLCVEDVGIEKMSRLKSVAVESWQLIAKKMKGGA